MTIYGLYSPFLTSFFFFFLNVNRICVSLMENVLFGGSCFSSAMSWSCVSVCVCVSVGAARSESIELVDWKIGTTVLMVTPEYRAFFFSAYYGTGVLSNETTCVQPLSFSYFSTLFHYRGFPSGSVVENLPAMQEPRVPSWTGKIPWSRKCNPLQYSCLENPMDRGAWQVTVHGVAKSQTWLSD